MITFWFLDCKNAKYRSFWLNFDFTDCFSDWFAANWILKENRLGIPGRFTCDRCGRSYKHKGNLTTHLGKGCTKQEIKCPHCPFKESRSMYLNSHIRCHKLDCRVHTCRFCHYMTPTFNTYLRHIWNSHRTLIWFCTLLINTIDTVSFVKSKIHKCPIVTLN